MHRSSSRTFASRAGSGKRRDFDDVMSRCVFNPSLLKPVMYSDDERETTPHLKLADVSSTPPDRHKSKLLPAIVPFLSPFLLKKTVHSLTLGLYSNLLISEFLILMYMTTSTGNMYIKFSFFPSLSWFSLHNRPVT